jgi:hypothetical protein
MAGAAGERGRFLTLTGCCVLVLTVPFFVTALLHLPGDAGFLAAPFACLAVALLLRRVPKRGRAFSWSWVGGCAAYAVLLTVVLVLFARGGVPGD